MRRFFRSMIYISAACAIVPSAVLLAQSPSTSPSVAAGHKSHWCFRGRPKPTCDNFWLTELGFAKRVTSDSAPLYTWELGWMVNRGTRRALGVGVFFQVEDETEFGIRPRLRLWMSRAISVDLAPGVILFGSGAGVGFSGHVELNFGDYAAVTAHVVSRPYARAPSAQNGVFVGGRVGSALGAIVGGAWLVFIAILSSDDS
jgi:hypothetical protein